MGTSRLLGLSGLILTVGCLHEAPETYDDGDPCQASPAGRACLTLVFSVTDRVLDEAPGDLRGDLHWGLYLDGDVGGLGPTEPSVAGDFVPDTDLSVPDAVVEVQIPDLEARSYQVLGYLDDDGDEESSGGDPVHLPSRGFDAPADVHTVVEVPLNYVR